MQDSLLFVGLFFSNVTLSNKVVVLSLMLQVIEVHLFIRLLVVFFKEHHVFLQIIFVFLHVFEDLLFVLGRVEYFVLHFSVLLVGVNFGRRLKNVFELAADEEFVVNGAEQFGLAFFVKV
jgi:hypothetical protein